MNRPGQPGAGSRAILGLAGLATLRAAVGRFCAFKELKSPAVPAGPLGAGSNLPPASSTALRISWEGFFRVHFFA